MNWLPYTGFAAASILSAALGSMVVRANRRAQAAKGKFLEERHNHEKEFRKFHTQRVHLESENKHLRHELDFSRSELNRLQDVLKSYTWSGPPLECDVLMLGPKDSGKSSIALKWKKPWTDIRAITPTSSWNEYQLALDDQISTSKIVRRHTDLGLELTHESRLHIRVRDYAGEDHMRFSAIEHLAQSARIAIVLFVFRVEYVDGKIVRTEEHAQYYSDIFVDAVRHKLAKLNKSLAKVIVVYNGVDELPAEWDNDKRQEELAAANEQALSQINRAFAPAVEQFTTSALTDEGLITLLGRIVTVAIGGPPDSPSGSA